MKPGKKHTVLFEGSPLVLLIRVILRWTCVFSNTGTKCNSLTQQFIGISTTIDTWATCFDSYRVIFRPSNNTDPIYKVVKCTVGSPLLCKHWGSHSALDYLVNWICIL